VGLGEKLLVIEEKRLEKRVFYAIISTMKTLLSIDPGTRKTGWAIFRNSKYLTSGAIIIKDKSLSWLQRNDVVGTRFDNLLSSYKINTVVIEEPGLFIMSVKGRAASNSGSILKLTALVHSLRVVARTRGIEVVLMPVRKWKGNVPKEITQRRIKRHLGIDVKQLDESDSVGLGMYYIKHFNMK